MNLVCVAPNGDLEIWKKLDEKKYHAWPAWQIQCDLWEGHEVVWEILGTIETPEFWAGLY